MELKDLLLMLFFIHEWNPSREDLCRKFGVSTATVARAIKDLRHLGADVVAKKQTGQGRSGGWIYEIQNWSAVQPLAERWLKLEMEREAVRLG